MELPDFSYEQNLWEKGFKNIAGIDEVGRGCLAGPVVTGCVVFDSLSFRPREESGEIPIINDSKKLSPKQRKLANDWIKKNSLKWGLGSATVPEINKHGIVKATNIAFRRAIINSEVKVDHLLIDAFYVPFIKGLRRKNQTPIIKGDCLSVSIAAASIIAKVHRDNLMLSLSKNPKYKKYGWGRNKGYGTKEHQLAIKKHGQTRLHRVSFLLKLS